MNDLPTTTSTSAPPDALAGEQVSRPFVLRFWLALIFAVWLFDLCFWNLADDVGFSFGLFFMGLNSAILLTRDKPIFTPRVILLVTLLLGAFAACALETGINNFFAFVMLTVALAGDSFYREEASFWGRALATFLSYPFLLGRVRWLLAVSINVLLSFGFRGFGAVITGAILLVPISLIVLVFAWLLATGNPVFAHWTYSFFDQLEKIITAYLNVGRIFLWCFMGLLFLPLLRPGALRSGWWQWLLQIPRVQPPIPVGWSLWGSTVTLILVNLLFLVANLADALFLWSGHTLPEGVSPRTFVHEGVNSLIVSVILTGLVLSVIFQQVLEVAQSRMLKAFAYVWIAQNLFLLTSVGLRLVHYVDDYGLTINRIGVVIFMCLVAAGLAVLVLKIWHDRSLSWLLGGGILLVFATFYITQFLDVAGWAVNYNVLRWERDRSVNLDGCQLRTYGPNAWPATRRVLQVEPLRILVTRDWIYENEEAIKGRATFDLDHWRSFSLRAWLNKDAALHDIK